MKMTAGNRITRGSLVAGAALLATLVGACAPPRPSLATLRAPASATDALHGPVTPAAPPSLPAPAEPAEAASAPPAADAAVPAPWQPPEAARRPYPRRVERWRGLVREVIAEEWQAGTLDGPAQRLDDDLVLAVIQQESHGDPQALSPAGAMGLMQVMPGTFALMMAGSDALAPQIDPQAFWDERSNVRAGIRYLALAMKNQEGNVYWSVASYNAGIRTVTRWRLAGLYAVPPVGGYAETAAYAQIVLRSYLGHRPGLEMFVPDPMPPEHVAGALQLLREFRRRGASGG